MARPIHYASHGAGKLAFDCFWQAWEEYVASSYEVPSKAGWPRTLYHLPQPQVRSDLRKVTCPHCWVEIEKMAQARAFPQLKESA